jgi:hypothetical protein
VISSFSTPPDAPFVSLTVVINTVVSPYTKGNNAGRTGNEVQLSNSTKLKSIFSIYPCIGDRNGATAEALRAKARPKARGNYVGVADRYSVRLFLARRGVSARSSLRAAPSAERSIFRSGQRGLTEWGKDGEAAVAMPDLSRTCNLTRHVTAH